MKHKQKSTMKCLACGREFQVFQTYIDQGRKYCSMECTYNARGFKIKHVKRTFKKTK